jgi:hypothetical protein
MPPSHSTSELAHELGARVTTYTFDAGPAGWEHENIQVVHTGMSEVADVWAVRKRGWCWNTEDDVWEHEPLPSSRDEEFYERCRFTLDQALVLAATIRRIENTRRADAR